MPHFVMMQMLPDELVSCRSWSFMTWMARLLYEVAINEAMRIIRGPFVGKRPPLCMIEASDTVYNLSQGILHGQHHQLYGVRGRQAAFEKRRREKYVVDI